MQRCWLISQGARWGNILVFLCVWFSDDVSIQITARVLFSVFSKSPYRIETKLSDRFWKRCFKSTSVLYFFMIRQHRSCFQLWDEEGRCQMCEGTIFSCFQFATFGPTKVWKLVHHWWVQLAVISQISYLALCSLMLRNRPNYILLTLQVH